MSEMCRKRPLSKNEDTKAVRHFEENNFYYLMLVMNSMKPKDHDLHKISLDMSFLTQNISQNKCSNNFAVDRT